MEVGDSFFVEDPNPRRSEIRRNVYNLSRRLPVLISTRKWTLNGKRGFRVWKTGDVGDLKPTLRPSLPTLRFLA